MAKSVKSILNGMAGKWFEDNYITKIGDDTYHFLVTYNGEYAIEVTNHNGSFLSISHKKMMVVKKTLAAYYNLEIWERPKSNKKERNNVKMNKKYDD